MNRPVVVKIGGAVLDEIAHMPRLWESIVRAHAQRLDNGLGGLIVCHGGGKAVDEHLRALGFESSKRDGIRITPVEQIDAVVATLAGVVNTRVVAALRGCGGPAVGLTLADAGTVEVVMEDRLGDGLGQVGRVAGGDGAVLKTLSAARYLSVVSSIGMAGDGSLVNVNADDAAEGVARATRADALVFLSDVPGVLDADGSVLSRLCAEDVDELISAGVVTGGMAAKIRAGAQAATRLARPVVIGHVEQAWALISSDSGAGTRIEPARVRTEPTGAMPVGHSN